MGNEKQEKSGIYPYETNIKPGWSGGLTRVTVLGPDVFCKQWWTPVYDKEDGDDPTFMKAASLEPYKVQSVVFYEAVEADRVFQEELERQFGEEEAAEKRYLVDSSEYDRVTLAAKETFLRVAALWHSGKEG